MARVFDPSVEIVLVATDGARTGVLADVRSVGHTEFYNSVQRGTRPQVQIDMRVQEYGGQEKIVHDGVMYTLIRSYVGSSSARGAARNPEIIELICGKVAADVGKN